MINTDHMQQRPHEKLPRVLRSLPVPRRRVVDRSETQAPTTLQEVLSVGLGCETFGYRFGRSPEWR